MRSVIISAVVFAAVGCTQELGSHDPAVSSETSAASDPSGAVAIDATPWKPGMTGLWPDGVTHLDTILTIGTTRDTFFAWGIADGEKVVWVYEVQTADRIAWATNEVNDQGHQERLNSRASHGGAGSVVGGNPPPRVGGEPQFPVAYQQRMIRSAAEIRDATDAALAFR